MNPAKITDPQEIDDAIERWHEGSGMDVPLHEYLGWTWDEYRAWLQDSCISPSLGGNGEQD